MDIKQCPFLSDFGLDFFFFLITEIYIYFFEIKSLEV